MDIFFEYLLDGLSAVDNEDSWRPVFTRKFNVAQTKYAMDRIKSLIVRSVPINLNWLHEAKISKVLEFKIMEHVPNKFRFDCPLGTRFNLFFHCNILQITLTTR